MDTDAADAPRDVITPPPAEPPVDVKARKGQGAADEFVEIIKTIVYALLIALVLRVILFQPFTIPSGSMIPNLLVGDYIIVSKYSYGYSRHSVPFSPPILKGRVLGRSPERGDVVVFKFPPNPRIDYIKRVIGLPGDKIQVLDGQVYLNGAPLPAVELPQQPADAYGSLKQLTETLPDGRRYVIQDMGPDSQTDSTPVFMVPEGHYFVMGDNRDNSQDSRVDQPSGVGFVPAENLVGKAQIILFSWREEASLFKPWTWFTEARPGRFFSRLK